LYGCVGVFAVVADMCHQEEVSTGAVLIKKIKLKREIAKY